jgi:RHS repeat-associated protein
MLASIMNTGAYPYILSYGYDSVGNVISRAIDSSTNTETTAYDGLGRVTQVTNVLGTFNYTPYNATNLVASISYPNGQTVSYSYYPSGASNERLQTITNHGPVTDGTLSQFSYAYSPAGDITSWTQQADSNTPVVYGLGYDGADELLSAVETSSTGGTALDTYTCRYDPAGNRLGQQMAVSGTSFVTSSQYNGLNQVTSVSGTSGLMLAISGSLSEPGIVQMSGSSGPIVDTDANNNFTVVVPVSTGSNNIPITATASGTTATQTTGTLSFNVAGGTPVGNFTYDANGNLTSDGIQNYVWDAADRLVQIWYGTVGSSASTTMNYDGLGRRVQIIETGSSGNVTSTKNLIWDGMTIREERNATNAVTKMYFDNGVQIGGSNYFYTRDHLRSIRELTDASEVIQARYTYDPSGQQTQLSGTMSADFGFAGLYYHQPSGLNLAAYRAYSAPLGRWISRDPLKDAEMRQGPNLYGYVGNNPVLYFDPLGLCIRLYSAPGFGNPDLSHEFFWSTDENEGVGENGSSGSILGNGVPEGFDPNNTSDPYVVLNTHGLTDRDFLDLAEDNNFSHLNDGPYVPFAHDCHNAAQRVYNRATGYNLNDPFPRVSNWWGATGNLLNGLFGDDDPDNPND